jgi:hypothetical protein
MNELKMFMKNPYTWFLSMLGYEVKPTSLLLMHMLDTTHATHFKTVQNQNRLHEYEVKHY